jgi:hypothetical protein
MQLMLKARYLAAAAVLVAVGSMHGSSTHAGVLAEDRADAMYHRYQGGGVTIDGPSVLVRKKFGDHFAATANYYVDMVSSASIDVLLNASPYTERREQKSLSVEYLRGKSTYSMGYINSKETDYDADTAFWSISQDMFGDLTTVTLGYKRGWNDIFRNVKQADGTKIRDPNFTQQSDVRSWSLGVSQVLTRNMILAINYEVIEDEGFLNSPYRSIRYADPTSGRGFGFDPELYPATHTSNAVSGRLKYFLKYRAAIDGSYRFYSDTWGVQANTVELGYTQPFRNWIFDTNIRYYKQDAADFYSDLFPRRNFSNFMARDKELATYTSYSGSIGAAYEFKIARLPWVQKSTLNFRYTHLFFDYDDFRDATKTDIANGILPGSEPLYQLNANVVQAFVSVWF